MKKFIVDTGKKKYTVKANDAMHAVEIVKRIDDKIKKPYSVVKIENRLGNVSVYGGPMSAEKAEQTAKYLRNRPEYRTCKIWVEKHGIEDSVVDDSIHDRLGEGKCAPTGRVSLVSSAEYASELLKEVQKNTSHPQYEKRLAIAKRKYDQVKAMIEHERQEIDAFDRYWQSHKKEMMANILAAEKALR